MNAPLTQTRFDFAACSRRRFLETAVAVAATAVPAQRVPASGPAGRGLFSPSAPSKPVLGIAEWYCYHINYHTAPPDDAVEQCVAAHEAVGIRHLVWAIGRATIDYHSRNPSHTLLGELGPRLGGDDWSPVIAIQRKSCTFRRAIAVSRDRGMAFWGRLGMNRFYGNEASIAATSRFSRQHPQFRERARGGRVDISRLCYAFDEVQAERLDILTEVQQLGVDGLVLDYCRQPPITRYHSRWGELYRKRGGAEPPAEGPRTLEQLQPWFQFRADVVTGFMRKLRRTVRDGEAGTGRRCGVVARISATSLLSNLAAGLDVAAWLRDDLVDGIMLSPLVFCPQATEFHFDDYVRLAHRYDKACIGGLGSLELIRNHVPNNTGYFRPEPAYRMLARQYAAGVDAMSVYQSESLARMDYLRGFLPLVGDPGAVRERAVASAGENVSPWLGFDWHTAREGKFAGYDLVRDL